MLNVNVDLKILSDHKSAESKSTDYLFEAIAFLYNFLGRRPEFSQEFKIHSGLLEALFFHFDESTKDLTSEEISESLENIRKIYQSLLREDVPVAPEDAERVYGVFSGQEEELVVSERVAFFAIVRDSIKLKVYSDSREKFWSIIFYFYGKLGSFIFSLVDFDGDPTFQSKLRKALTPSLNPEDVYFEFSIAHEMKRQGVVLRFIPEQQEIRTPDFEILIQNTLVGYLECTVRRQRNRKMIEHIKDGLTKKEQQMLNGFGLIKCLAICMPYDLQVNNLQTRVVNKNGINLIYLTDENGVPFEKSQNETLDVAEALKSQDAFTHLLVTSNQFLRFMKDGVGWFPKRRLFQKKTEHMFPGIWAEGIFLI